MLHKIAAGTTHTAQQQIAFLGQARAAGFSFQPREMKELDGNAKKLTLASVVSPDGLELVHERQISYDTLIIAVGSQANDFGTPGISQNCFMIDSRRQANAFNNELRVRMMQTVAYKNHISISIVGGGRRAWSLLQSSSCSPKRLQHLAPVISPHAYR